MKTDELAARYIRDRERVLGSKAFRRLAGKTQVVSLPENPLVRSRLTHTLEVASIAREIGRGLGLVDPLVEAIALAHDLGHPAFGHAGERALAAIVPGGFHHASQGVRAVTVLESGLDLTPEVVDGILKHSKGRAGTVFAVGSQTSLTREARVVRAADLFAYACHDLDDAYLLGELRAHDLPPRSTAVLGDQPAEVRRTLVWRTVRASLDRGDMGIDNEAETALDELRSFLYDRLYESPAIQRQTTFVRGLFQWMWESATTLPRAFDRQLRRFGMPPLLAAPIGETFADAVACMTDRQALELGRSLPTLGKVWSLPSWQSPRLAS